MSFSIGSGDHKYELAKGWEQLPEGITHRDVACVSTDESGNVYLLCRGDHPIVIYDRSGAFLGTWGEGQFTYRTHGAYMSAGNQLFLVDDGAHSVGRYTLDGSLVTRYGPSGVASDSGYDGENYQTITHGAPPFNRPTNVSVAPSGDVYVSDGYGNCRIHRFTNDGELIQSWGEPGVDQGQLNLPHSIWAHPDGRIFVCDRENDRIQTFSADGEFLEVWTTDVQRPADIFVDQQGLVYVAELSRHKGTVSARRGLISEEEPPRVTVYDADANVLVRWGGADTTAPGNFIAPHGISVDDEGSIYVAEVTWSNGVSKGYAPADGHTFQKFARA